VLGKSADMPTKSVSEPTGSLAPRTSSEPIRPRDAAITNGPTATRRRNRASSLLAGLLGALRGDKYMVGAYAPHWHGAASPTAEPRATPAVPPLRGDCAASRHRREEMTRLHFEIHQRDGGTVRLSRFGGEGATLAVSARRFDGTEERR
jgi:hypothetical protein